MANLAKIWDRQSPINGVAAEEILKDAFMRNARELFIVYDEETNIVTRIESVDVIKMNNKLSGYTDQQVMDWYIEDMEKPVPEPEPVPETPSQAELDIMETQIALFEQSSMILEAVSTLQASSASN